MPDSTFNKENTSPLHIPPHHASKIHKPTASPLRDTTPHRRRRLAGALAEWTATGSPARAGHAAQVRGIFTAASMATMATPPRRRPARRGDANVAAGCEASLWGVTNERDDDACREMVAMARCDSGPGVGEEARTASGGREDDESSESWTGDDEFLPRKVPAAMTAVPPNTPDRVKSSTWLSPRASRFRAAVIPVLAVKGGAQIVSGNNSGGCKELDHFADHRSSDGDDERESE